jgi:hypothetical protein
MQLSCVNCGEPIPAKHINIQKTLAVCEHCDTVFNFGEDLSPSAAKSKRRKVKQPDHVTVWETDDSIEVKSRWRLKNSPATFSVLMFIWLLASMVISTIGTITEQKPEMLLFGLLLGAFPLYTYLSFFINYTQLHMDDQLLTVGSKPMPWFDHKQLDIHQIKTVSYKTAQTFDSFYDLQAQMEDGRTVNLIECIPYEEVAFLAQQINEYLTQLGEEDNTLAHDLDDSTIHPALFDAEMDLTEKEQVKQR